MRLTCLDLPLNLSRMELGGDIRTPETLSSDSGPSAQHQTASCQTTTLSAKSRIVRSGAFFTTELHPLHNLNMDVDTIPNFLTDQRDAAPADLQHLFLSFEDFWERKLWHQLTDSLVEYFKHPESASQRLPIYNTFILSFADKINQLKLVTLGLSASTQCKGRI